VRGGTDRRRKHGPAPPLGSPPPQASTRKSEVNWGIVLRSLTQFYSKGSWRVPVLRRRRADPFHVLISTVLSHRSRDALTLRAFTRLVARFSDARSLSEAKPAIVAGLIRPVGLSESKARGLIGMAQVIRERYGGEVPTEYEELLELPWVGPKTASAVLVFGFDRAAIPVDTHIHRVVNRLGVVSARRPEESQKKLERIVPRRYWGMLNPVLVQHGQNICTARNPHCGVCPILKWCVTGKSRIRRDRVAARTRPRSGR
jgi:endonuclease III